MCWWCLLLKDFSNSIILPSNACYLLEIIFLKELQNGIHCFFINSCKIHTTYKFHGIFLLCFWNALLGQSHKTKWNGCRTCKILDMWCRWHIWYWCQICSPYNCPSLSTLCSSLIFICKANITKIPSEQPTMFTIGLQGRKNVAESFSPPVLPVFVCLFLVVCHLALCNYNNLEV